MTHRFRIAQFVRVLSVAPFAAVASFAPPALAQQPTTPPPATPPTPPAATPPVTTPPATTPPTTPAPPAEVPPATPAPQIPPPNPAPYGAPPVNEVDRASSTPGQNPRIGSPEEQQPLKTNPEAPLESSDQPVPVKGKWNPVLYGFVEFDGIHDSTQSFNDSAGNAAITEPGKYAGDHSRTIFGVRNSRLGFKLTAPETRHLRATGLLEMDFLGNQSTSTSSEAQIWSSPLFRIRHFAMKIEDPYVDVLIGQYWQLFGWQSYFHPNTVEIQGVPGQVYSRSPQVRISHAFKTDPVTVELALAASRPPQRDSAVPDGQAGLRILINDWKGLHTAGATGTSVDALAVGVSAVGRHFRLPEFAATPKTGVEKNGGGISVDALIPVIPATIDHRENGLSLTGSFVTGSGIADLYTGLTGGVGFPKLPNPMMLATAPTYTPDIDPGIVTFDSDGNLHPINWQSYMVGLQYYLPPSGKIWISGNYSHMKSNNAADYVADKSTVFTKSDWVDGNIFWDALPPLRLGVEYAYFHQTYGDDKTAKNHRVQFSAWYMF
ncbi:MAG TPA: hypothetical protein VHC69_22845 [Polyangiaceae bacterium]|nr:hypothetical protein [Polyangiaceae bacterium]